MQRENPLAVKLCLDMHSVSLFIFRGGVHLLSDDVKREQADTEPNNTDVDVGVCMFLTDDRAAVHSEGRTSERLVRLTFQ